jgi:hypothetical protein
MRVILLMTIRDYNFEYVGLKPNPKPRAGHTNLDTVYGDVVFQELGFSARPKAGMMMKCTRTKSTVS